MPDVSGDYQFRPATNADVPEIKNLVSSVLAEVGLGLSPESGEADLDDIEATYTQAGGTFEGIVAADGRIVGCCGLRPIDIRRIELRYMCVLPEVRGQGLRRQLLKRMLNVARRRGYEEVRLEVNENIGDATRLYENCGFIPVGDVPERRTYRRLLPRPSPKVSTLGWWPQGREFGVPRRFSIAMLLIVTAFYSALFAALRILRAPVAVFALIAGFVTCVGVGQAVLFKGKHPRRASVVAGILAAWLVFFSLIVYAMMSKVGVPSDTLSSLFCGAVAFTVAGAALGSFVGALIEVAFWSLEPFKNLPRRKGGPITGSADGTSLVGSDGGRGS